MCFTVSLSSKNCFSWDITSLIYCYIASSIYKFLSSGKHLIVLYNIFITFHMIWSLFLDIIFRFILHNKANINVIFGVVVVGDYPSFSLHVKAFHSRGQSEGEPEKSQALAPAAAGPAWSASWHIEGSFLVTLPVVRALGHPRLLNFAPYSIQEQLTKHWEIMQVDSSTLFSIVWIVLT